MTLAELEKQHTKELKAEYRKGYRDGHCDGFNKGRCSRVAGILGTYTNPIYIKPVTIPNRYSPYRVPETTG